MEVGAVQVNGDKGFSGTVAEESGVSLSFSVTGTIRTMNVDEGQMVSRGQLVATVNGGLEPGDQLIVEGQQMVSESTPCQIIK